MAAAEKSETGRKPRIAVSMGDPNGIGPEVLAKCFTDSDLLESVELMPVGSPAVFDHYTQMIGGGSAPSTFIAIDGLSDGVFHPGQLNQHSGAYSMSCVESAVHQCLSGSADAMVTCPISKEAIAAAGYDFPGHTEFIAKLTASESELMMMVSEGLRVSLVTTHIPVSRISSTISQDLVSDTIAMTVETLRQDFGIDSPQIAVLGLNPHAGDGGVLGSEEKEIIMPAMKRFRLEADVFGPFPADGFFGSATWKAYDAVVAMYHDQGLIPFKALSFGKGVNFTAGLPIVRTSPDHGTAFDIAGGGIADEGSLKTAIRLAAQVFQQRKNRNEQKQES